MMALYVENVKKIFPVAGKEYTVLRKIDLQVEASDFVSIVGRSGSGKSTLLNIVGGLEEPTSGNVTLDGQNIYELRESQRSNLRKDKIGFVFQSFNLLPVLTARENVELPANAIERDYVFDLFDTLGIRDKIDSMPSQMSGGQQQRVAIARALVNHPSVILADEPTGNLDEESEKVVMALFRQLVNKYNTSIIMITHNAALAEQTDTTYRLLNGVLAK